MKKLLLILLSVEQIIITPKICSMFHFVNIQDYWKSDNLHLSPTFIWVSIKKLNVSHHTLFFDTEFDEHAIEIYKTKQWPKNPLFYASFQSTDQSFALKDVNLVQS